jgi:hypothetical protein
VFRGKKDNSDGEEEGVKYIEKHVDKSQIDGDSKQA